MTLWFAFYPPFFFCTFLRWNYIVALYGPRWVASISASYGFFLRPQHSTAHTIFDNDDLPNTNTIDIIFSTTIGFQPPKMGWYALRGPLHKAISPPPYKA
jgi:hypothetical protein